MLKKGGQSTILIMNDSMIVIRHRIACDQLDIEAVRGLREAVREDRLDVLVWGEQELLLCASTRDEVVTTGLNPTRRRHCTPYRPTQHGCCAKIVVVYA